MGWDGIDFGYGVATALKIVLWATAFPSQAFHPLGQQGYSREKSSPQPKPGRPVQYYSIKVGKRKPELTGREGTDDRLLERGRSPGQERGVDKKAKYWVERTEVCQFGAVQRRLPVHYAAIPM